MPRRHKGERTWIRHQIVEVTEQGHRIT